MWGVSLKRERNASVAVFVLVFRIQAQDCGGRAAFWRCRFVGTKGLGRERIGPVQPGGRSGRPPSGGPVRSDRKNTRSSRVTRPVGPRSITGRTIQFVFFCGTVTVTVTVVHLAQRAHDACHRDGGPQWPPGGGRLPPPAGRPPVGMSRSPTHRGTQSRRARAVSESASGFRSSHCSIHRRARVPVTHRPVIRVRPGVPATSG